MAARWRSRVRRAGSWGGAGEEAVEERAQVEAGASGEDGEGLPLGEVVEDEACMACVVAGGAGLVGVVEVEQVVRDLGSFEGVEGLAVPSSMCR